MGLGIVKTSWTTVILPPYSSSIILGYLIYRKTFTHSLLVCLFFFGASIPSVIESVKHPHSFIDYYYCYTVLCFPLFLLVELVFLMQGLFMRRNIVESLFEGMWTNIYYPFYNIYVFLACIFQRYFSPTAVAEFIAAVLLIGFNALGILNVAGVVHFWSEKDVATSHFRLSGLMFTFLHLYA